MGAIPVVTHAAYSCLQRGAGDQRLADQRAWRPGTEDSQHPAGSPRAADRHHRGSAAARALGGHRPAGPERPGGHPCHRTASSAAWPGVGSRHIRRVSRSAAAVSMLKKRRYRLSGDILKYISRTTSKSPGCAGRTQSWCRRPQSVRAIPGRCAHAPRPGSGPWALTAVTPLPEPRMARRHIVGRGVGQVEREQPTGLRRRFGSMTDRADGGPWITSILAQTQRPTEDRCRMHSVAGWAGEASLSPRVG